MNNFIELIYAHRCLFEVLQQWKYILPDHKSIPLEFEQQQPIRHISVEAMNVSILEYLKANHWTCFSARRPLQGNTDMDQP